MVLMHNGEVVAKYPAKTFSCPDVFNLILDMDQGTLAFEVDGEYLGVAFSDLGGQSLHTAVSAVWGSCEVKLRYIGGSTGKSFVLSSSLFHYVSPPPPSPYGHFLNE